MEPIDLGAIIQSISVYTAVLVGIILGLVEYAKKLGLNGNGSLVLSMALGILFGAGYYLASFGVPVDLAGCFILVLAALIPGLVASGVYDFSDRFRSR